jgi:hypothetical protein
LEAIRYSLSVRSRELGTSRWALALYTSQCESLSPLAKTRVWISTKSLCNYSSRNVRSISI